MLYYADMEIVPGKVTQVVLLSKLTIEGHVTHFGFDTILGDEKVASVMSTYGDRILVEAVGNPDNELPFPVVNPATPATSLVNASSLYKFFLQQPSFSSFEDFDNKVKNPLFPSDTVRVLKNSIDTIKSYIKGEENFKILIPEIFYSNPIKVREVIKDYNGKFGHRFTFASINKTNFMNSENDQFFIELPDYEKLRSPDVGLGALIPDPKDIANPYPHPIYYTPYASRVFKSSPAQLRELLREVNDLVGLTPEQMDGVPKIKLEHLVGDASNNDLPIQPNEMEFYTALEEYIKYDISQTFPGADVEEKFKECVCSPRMMEFLQLLIETSARLNWCHTNKIPIGYADDDDEDDDNTSANSVMERALFLNLGEMQITDGLTILERFIDAASKSGLGFHAYIEAIIRLARFGSVKPSCLKLGNYNRYLDLNDFYIRNNSGNLSTMQPILVNGHEYSFEGLVGFDDKFRDVKFRESVGIESSKISIPIGLVCKKHFNGEVHQTVYMYFGDVVSAYKNNPTVKLIDGISFDGEKFLSSIKADEESVIPLRLARESVTSSSDKAFIFYSSDLMKQITLEYSCPELTSLDILNEFLYSTDSLSRQYEQLKFDSKAELANKMALNPLPIEIYVRTNLGGKLVPTVLKASEKFEEVFTGEYDIAQILNIYKEAMTHESAVKSSSNEPQQQEVNKQEGTSVMDSTVDKLQKMASFSTQKDESDNYYDKIWSTFISPIRDTEKVLSIVDDGNIVGGFVVRQLGEKSKVYIIGDLSVVPAGTPKSANTLTSIETLVFDALWNILSRTPEKAQVKFHSVETVKYYRSLLNEKIKRLAGKG